MTDYIRKYADISGCGRYRYLLQREWRGTASDENWHWYGTKDGAGQPIGTPKSCMFVMLNPSTADADIDDPTIRRCVGFAKALKFDELSVVNLFAYRATKPKDLFAAGEAVHGDRNQEVIEKAGRDAGMIICAWGAHEKATYQAECVRGWLHNRKLYALGFTKDGHPKHPLYLPGDARPVPMPN